MKYEETEVDMSFIDDTSKACSGILEEYHYLKELSDAFYLTGNKVLGKDLRDCADNLYLAQNAIGKAVGKEINDNSIRSQQASENMLKAALIHVIKDEG